MTCDAFRPLLSARLDGELAADDDARLDAHLDECPACTAHADQAAALQRTMRLHASAALGSMPTKDRRSIIERVRAANAMQIALFVIGVTLVAINVGGLVAPDSIDRHLTRHDAVFGTALGIGMVSVAWRPHRAMGLVPITSAITALMVVVAIADLAGSRATMMAEAVHLLEFAGLLCLWLLSGGTVRMRQRWAAVSGRPLGSTVPGWPA